MSDSLWNWLAIGAIAYVAYRYLRKNTDTLPRFTVLSGGLQFNPAGAPPPTIPGGAAPQNGVVSWPGSESSC